MINQHCRGTCIEYVGILAPLFLFVHGFATWKADSWLSSWYYYLMVLATDISTKIPDLAADISTKIPDLAADSST